MAAAAATGAGLVLAVGASAATPPITQSQSGRTFHLRLGGTATLHLAHGWSWSEPRVSSRAVELTPIMYFRDPGFSAWDVHARARGTATIRSVGTPACSPCGLPTRLVRVTIAVA